MQPSWPTVARPLLDQDGLRIERDGHGVPHVRARTEADLYWGLGWVHGHDRALQLLVTRIVAQGRLTELLQDSDANAEADRHFRRVGLYVGAEAEADKLDPGTRALADAYVAGVNGALRRRVPWELRLLGLREPEPWTLADSITLSRLMGYLGLAQTQGDVEHFALELVQAGVPDEWLRALFGDRMDGLDEEAVRKVRLRDHQIPPRIRATLPAFAASNHWVLHGSKTRSGAPILANDPHLEVNRLPGVWCEAVLRCDERGADWYAMGATVPGLPALIIGRTPQVAWGVTYAYQDGIDNWVEECRDGRCRRGRDWVAPERRPEVLRRKKAGDEVLEVFENGHGVLSGDPAEAGFLLATRWAPGRGTGAASLATFHDLLSARDMPTVLGCLGRVETAWNWVAAATDGRIGYQMSGLAPRRRTGWNGFVPGKGWDKRDDWRGFHDPRDLPRHLDPPDGFFTTANNTLTHLGKAPVQNLTMGDYRASAMADRLAARGDWTVEDCQKMQMDPLSRQAERFLPVLRPLLPDTKAAQVLRDWDGRYTPDSHGAWLFEKFYDALLDEVVGGRLGPGAARYMREETGLLAGFHRLFDDVYLDEDNVWYGGEGRDAVWRRVLADVCRGRTRPWRSRIRFRMAHLLLGTAPGVSRGPLVLGGSRASILQFQKFRAAGRLTTFAPSYRFIADLGEDGAHTILAGGPSDRPGSRWYTSDVRGWVAGRLKRLRP